MYNNFYLISHDGVHRFGAKKSWSSNGAVHIKDAIVLVFYNAVHTFDAIVWFPMVQYIY